ncbi:hypothetical protein GGR53DRAFT_515050 [Hypoxylon sp. FL1150]|nr:hypothetical protein GGR53DRAFT_515050 [Hypoxylon sp. FL1150]
MSSQSKSRSSNRDGGVAGPINNNLFIEDGQNVPAWYTDLSLEPNPALRGGPYATAFMDYPECTMPLPLRPSTPSVRQVMNIVSWH